MERIRTLSEIPFEFPIFTMEQAFAQLGTRAKPVVLPSGKISLRYTVDRGEWELM